MLTMRDRYHAHVILARMGHMHSICWISDGCINDGCGHTTSDVRSGGRERCCTIRVQHKINYCNNKIIIETDRPNPTIHR